MHIAVSYGWLGTTAGDQFDRALQSLGHRVTYVGLPRPSRPGYDNTVSVRDIGTFPDQPDLYVWIDPAGRCFPPGIEDLPIPTVCYLIDVHIGRWREQVARFFDAVFVAQKDYLGSFQRAVGHEQVYWLPLAATPGPGQQHDALRVFDVGFVGNISLAHRRTPRSRRLRLVAEHFRTNDFGRPYKPEEVGQVYGQSQIVFNTSIAGDVNMRVFEATACGALLLTDSAKNGLAELFDIGKEIAVYGDDAELLDRIGYYLSHTEERAGIAAAGRRRTLSEHTYAHRAQAVVQLVTAPQFERRAPMRQASPGERLGARREVYTHLHMLDALFDATRGQNPLRRVWSVAPCLIRRVLM